MRQIVAAGLRADVQFSRLLCSSRTVCGLRLIEALQQYHCFHRFGIQVEKASPFALASQDA
jgi:hypothetical protein